MGNTSSHLYAARISPGQTFQLRRYVLTYGEEKFKVTMLLLEHVDGLKVSK